ncbi:MAG: NfeD family protein [Nitrospira sp.]|nr:NfeD family protein [bacterium]MBL7048556.1 NfeD family protein [Nitrospira sp.]
MFENLNGLEIVFAICAGIGGIVLTLRIIMQFIGADADTDIDADIDLEHMDADVSFKLISIDGLTSFLLMFGLVGYALYRQSGSGALIAVSGGTIAGLASVWVMGKLFAFIHGLQSRGNIDISTSVGSNGTVYLTIPANGIGRVTINFNNHLREYDAKSHSKQEIKTGTPIKVIWVEGNTLIVDIINK